MNDKQEKLQVVYLSQLKSSNYNSRKTFNQKTIDELAEGIRANGLINPITVRLIKSKSTQESESLVYYEVVAGERRFRALKSTTDAPEIELVEVIVRDYTDDQVEAIQLAENIHREELDPLEECDAYHKMYNRYKGMIKDVDIYNSISATVNKPVNYIRTRMELKNLNTQFKNKLERGIITVSHALILAKLPTATQKECLDWIGNNNIPTVDQLKKRIEDSVYVPLNNAPFNIKDNTLLKSAGACVDCSFNTGVNTMLFSDLTDESYCIKGSCFLKKRDKYLKLRIEELQKTETEFILIRNTTYDNGYDNQPKNYLGHDVEFLFNYEITKNKDCATLGIIVQNSEYSNWRVSKLEIGDEFYFVKKKHEKQQSNVTSAIPVNESPIEQRERRMNKRFFREDNLDKVEVRKDIAQTIFRENLPLKSSLIKEIAMENFYECYNQAFILKFYGCLSNDIKETDSCGYKSWNMPEDLEEKLCNQIRTDEQLLHFLKCLTIANHLQLHRTQDVNVSDPDDDELIQYASEYGIDITGLHKVYINIRDKERADEIASLEAAKEKYAEKIHGQEELLELLIEGKNFWLVGDWVYPGSDAIPMKNYAPSTIEKTFTGYADLGTPVEVAKKVARKIGASFGRDDNIKMIAKSISHHIREYKKKIEKKSSK